MDPAASTIPKPPRESDDRGRQSRQPAGSGENMASCRQLRVPRRIMPGSLRFSPGESRITPRALRSILYTSAGQFLAVHSRLKRMGNHRRGARYPRLRACPLLSSDMHRHQANNTGVVPWGITTASSRMSVLFLLLVAIYVAGGQEAGICLSVRPVNALLPACGTA